MPEYLANAYFEEPDALIVLVLICGDASRVTGGVTRNKTRKDTKTKRVTFILFSRFVVFLVAIKSRYLSAESIVICFAVQDGGACNLAIPFLRWEWMKKTSLIY